MQNYVIQASVWWVVKEHDVDQSTICLSLQDWDRNFTNIEIENFNNILIRMLYGLSAKIESMNLKFVTINLGILRQG